MDLKFRCVKCLPLRKVLKTSSQAPMSNLRVHLRKIHPDTMAEFDELVKTLPKRPRKPKAPTEFSFNKDKSRLKEGQFKKSKSNIEKIKNLH